MPVLTRLIPSPVVVDIRPGALDDLATLLVDASAGGVQALESLFQRIPSDTGMAFVVLEQVSPDQQSQQSQTTDHGDEPKRPPGMGGCFGFSW